MNSFITELVEVIKDKKTSSNPNDVENSLFSAFENNLLTSNNIE